MGLAEVLIAAAAASLAGGLWAGAATVTTGRGRTAGLIVVALLCLNVLLLWAIETFARAWDGLTYAVFWAALVLPPSAGFAIGAAGAALRWRLRRKED